MVPRRRLSDHKDDRPAEELVASRRSDAQEATTKKRNPKCRGPGAREHPAVG